RSPEGIVKSIRLAWPSLYIRPSRPNRATAVKAEMIYTAVYDRSAYGYVFAANLTWLSNSSPYDGCATFLTLECSHWQYSSGDSNAGQQRLSYEGSIASRRHTLH